MNIDVANNVLFIGKDAQSCVIGVSQKVEVLVFGILPTSLFSVIVANV